MYSIARLNKLRNFERKVGYFKDGGFGDHGSLSQNREFIEGEDTNLGETLRGFSRNKRFYFHDKVREMKQNYFSCEDCDETSNFKTLLDKIEIEKD